MKKVFSNSEIPHLWAHQQQDEARNANGTFYFKGATIFSYGSHFPIATHVTNVRGEKAILVTTRQYSVTTQRHISRVRQSLPPAVPVFHVDLTDIRYDRLVMLDLPAQIATYNEEGREQEMKAAHSRQQYSVNYHLTRAMEINREAVAFAKFYDLDAATVFTPTADMDTLKAAAKAEAARKAGETRKRKAEQAAKYADSIAAWLRGDSSYVPHDVDTLLRIADGEVETSRGARFPVSHARRGLVLVEAVRASGETWKRNGHTCHLGPYQIDRIDPTGTVHAGCHVVPWSSIERIKPQIEAATLEA